VEKIVEAIAIGKRDPRSACERGGGAAVNINWVGGMTRDQKFSGVFFVLRAWWVGQAKPKYVSPSLLRPTSPAKRGERNERD